MRTNRIRYQKFLQNRKNAKDQDLIFILFNNNSLLMVYEHGFFGLLEGISNLNF